LEIPEQGVPPGPREPSASDERDVEGDVDGFFAEAIEKIPGSVELSATGSTWVARPGPYPVPTPEQCADPAERIRLWQEHGVHWVRYEPERPKVELPDDFVLEAWKEENGYPALERWFLCRARKKNG
jgi:hypothetical protein